MPIPCVMSAIRRALQLGRTKSNGRLNIVDILNPYVLGLPFNDEDFLKELSLDGVERYCPQCCSVRSPIATRRPEKAVKEIGRFSGKAC
ncbi:hypothetical protein PoB_006765800 [Plakobranchus ocellatus]|uniref:Uncharacterized protein n=1 Tax=Plakobranchus ocellatus TaxID=259542 RepID=A0AAV4DAR3_9GAST|nr:hypothetical protein PoB_006765800 [Plakobranchus ocellatus]